jgi:hypothetical protein
VVADTVEGKTGTYNVIFVATSSGVIRKMLNLPTEKEPCLVEEIKVTPNGDHKPIKQLRISKQHVSDRAKSDSTRPIPNVVRKVKHLVLINHSDWTTGVHKSDPHIMWFYFAECSVCVHFKQRDANSLTSVFQVHHRGVS